MIKSYLKKVFSIASLACMTLSTASAKHFTTNNIEFMEVVSVEKKSFNPEKYPVDVVICQFKSDNELPPKINNDFVYNNKKYSIKNLKILENKFVVGGVTYIEVQDLDTLHMARLATDVILYDAEDLLQNIINLTNELTIPKYFEHNNKSYRVKAINKDITDKCREKKVKIEICQDETNYKDVLENTSQLLNLCKIY